VAQRPARLVVDNQERHRFVVCAVVRPSVKGSIISSQLP